jgi:hypothetical protein
MSHEAPTMTRTAGASGSVPTRFREAEARGRRLARGYLRATGLGSDVDEALMARIGAALMERDEVGAKLAAAMRPTADSPRRVSHADVRAALAGEIPENAPPELTQFLAAIHDVPDWVDWELVDDGARAFMRLGQSAEDVLLELSLIGGYRFGGPTDLLVQTGGLAGRRALHRLAETQYWTSTFTSADALRPGGEAWRLTAHVRAMHALVNAALEASWEVERWGLPINMADQAGTLGLFDGVLLAGCRVLGVRIDKRDAAAMMHMWKYVGWLLGVSPEFLTDVEHERHRINYHVLLAAADQSDAGPQLAQRLVAAQLERHFAGTPRWLRPLRGRYERARLLSMLTLLLGRRSMRAFGLPRRLPWAVAVAVGRNLWRYQVLRRLPGSARRFEVWGARVRRRNRLTYRPIETGDVGELPAQRDHARG